jgi:hypothetical protein
MASLPTQDWRPTVGRQPIPDDLLSAIGAGIVSFSALEGTLYLFFQSFLETDIEIINLIFDSLSNRVRVDFVRKLTERYKFEEAEIDAVLFALKLFDICCENRNYIAHADLWKVSDDGFIFVKTTNSSSGSQVGYLWTIEHLRDAASAMSQADEYLGVVWNTLNDRHVRNRRRQRAKLPPLPDRPVQPRKLSLYRLPEDHPDAPSPPQP